MDYNKIKINTGDDFFDLDIDNINVSHDKPMSIKFSGKEEKDKEFYVTVRFRVKKCESNKEEISFEKLLENIKGESNGFEL